MSGGCYSRGMNLDALAELINCVRDGFEGVACDALLVLGITSDEIAEVMGVEPDEIPTGDNE